MYINNTPDTFINRIFLSPKTKKTAVIFLLSAIIICFISLLPAVQNLLFSFVDVNTSSTSMRASGAFGSRLTSLLSLPFFALIVFVFSFCCLFSKQISVFLENKINAKLIILSASGLILFLLVFISIFSYRYGWQWLNSDHSSEMVLAKLLAEENSFASSNWRYSTEIRLIYQTIFSMPLFKLLGNSGNWALIRSLTILLNNIILLLSYFYMAKKMKIETKWIFISSLFLLLPLSLFYWDITIFGGYYIIFIAQIFFCLGLYINIVNFTKITKAAIIDFILFTLLSFALGLQGIRSVLCVHIPLLISCIYVYSKKAEKYFPIFAACYGFIICCAGFAGNFLLHFKYSFHSFDTMQMENLYLNFLPKFGQSLIALTGFFGFNNGASLLSATGLFGVAAIIGTIIFFYVIINSIRKTRYQTSGIDIPFESRFIYVFFIASLIFNIFVFIITNEYITNRYFIPFMVLYIPLLAVFFSIAEKSFSYLKRTAIIAGIILFIFGQSYLNFQSLAAFDVNSSRKGYIQYLSDNKLKFGFATFLHSNVTTELTNGKIEMAGLEPKSLEPDTGVPLKIQGWLNKTKYYDPSYYQGESFLLLTRAEWDAARKSERPFTQLHPDYEDSDFIIIRYPSAGIIHHDVLDN